MTALTSSQPAASTRRIPVALLVAALALAACALCAMPSQALAKVVNPYGQLCAEYESGNDPACVVTGTAYGAYQFSPSVAYSFAVWLADRDASGSAKLLKAYKNDGNTCSTKFDKVWKTVCNADSDAFARSQYLYAKKLYLTPVVKKLKANYPGFKAKNYSSALRNVIFSTGVQHGSSGAYSIISKAFTKLGGYSTSLSEEKIIKKIYKVRAGYTTKKKLKAQGVSASIINTMTAADLNTYESWGLLTSKQVSNLKGKALVNFYSSSSATQVGVYYRLFVREKASALEMYEECA